MLGKKAKAWKSLTNIQIEELLENRGVANYRETYSKDTLPHKPKANESLVINLKIPLMVMAPIGWPSKMMGTKCGIL